MKSLAVKYRPKTFDDVQGQDTIKQILQHQVETKTMQHGYLFCGGAGTGKTTCARIFAHSINSIFDEDNLLTCTELDAASNNSVDDIRRICENANRQPVLSCYNIYIIDECHSLSNQAWQAMLKTLEEPPAKAIFIFCTTNPEKIPQTILSRVQRYNFQKLDKKLVYDRLAYICEMENIEIADSRALSYITKLSNGGMRDAITMLDICSSYSNKLTLETVECALNTVSYDTLFKALDAILYNDERDNIFKFVDSIEKAGTDLKWFFKQFFEFTVDLSAYMLHHDFDLVHIPDNYLDTINSYGDIRDQVIKIMRILKQLCNDLKYEQNPKPIILATFI